MIDWAVGHVPVLKRVDGFFWFALIPVVFAAGFLANFGYRAHSYTQVRVTHPSVTQMLGRPDQTVDGAQVNSALAGFVCDVYRRGVVYCHH